MMGHTTKSQKNTARLGFSDSNDSKDPEDEVNDYLMRAIDARSIDRLRSEHCKSVLLSFKKANVERKVSSFGMAFFLLFFLSLLCLFFWCFRHLHSTNVKLFSLFAVYFRTGSYAGQIFVL